MGVKELISQDGRKKFVVLVLIGAVLLGMGTWAFWSDTEIANNNTVAAGTLDLTVNDGATAGISLTNAQPGDTASETFTLKNVGSTAADHVEITLGFAENDTRNEPADSGLDTELNATDTAAMIKVTTLTYNGNNLLGSVTDANGNGIIDLADVQSQSGTLDNLAAPAANGNQAIDFTLGVEVANANGAFTGTDEKIMADGIDIELTFTLNQDKSQ